MRWFVGGALAYLATLIGVLGLCRAAAEGDRALQAHYPPLGADEQEWAELVARLEGPTTWCATCGQPTTDDRLWCDATCQTVWDRP